MSAPEPDAVVAIRSLVDSGTTVAAAESLTGGLLCAALTSVPGASAVVRGGLVVYATELKASLAGVPRDVLERHGPVSREVAGAMARGVRQRLGADIGIATTGVAGPDPQDDHPPGTVHIAVATPTATVLRSHTGADVLVGDRHEIRAATVRVALGALADAVSAITRG